MSLTTRMNRVFRRFRVSPLTILPLLAGLVFSAFPMTAGAQYFGQNKVNYKVFDWYYIKTEHFDIYHPKGSYKIAEFAGRVAEESLREIQESFGYTLKGRIIFVVYPSHNSFQNTNVGGGSPGESTGGFTEFLKNRVIIPYQGSYEAFRHVIHHELTHAVMLRMLYGEGVQSIITGISRMPLPIWFIEGLAEYESQGGWSNEADMYLRDAIVNDYLPPIPRLSGYFIYKGGESILYYLDRRYGSQKVGELLRQIRRNRDFGSAVKEAIGVNLEELSKRWHRYLKREIWPSAAPFESPEDFALKITDHEKWWNFVNTSPALSPDGDRLAILSDKNDYPSIYLVNTITGKVERRLVKGENIYVFEQLLWLRPWIDWSPDGREIVFVVESNGEDALYTMDVETGKITREYYFGLDGLFSPVWSPKGDRIAFAAYKDGQSDIYMVDVDDPGSLTKLTDDIFSDYDPAWDPTGSRLLFVSDRGDNLEPVPADFPMWEHEYRRIDLYMADLPTGKLRRLTDDAYEERTPKWTPRENVISFVSDRNGAYNLYLMDLPSGDSWAVTDVVTGVFTPSWSKSGTVAFSSFYNAGYDIFLYKNPFDPDRRKSPTLTGYQKKLRMQDESQSLAAEGFGRPVAPDEG
ncbi:MAG TPA: peptidase S9, partial [Bacteroidetes bacterium]|nr:peptidase S9 [Bacteroidota bacterium]